MKFYLNRKMTFYLKSKEMNIDAVANYNPETGEFTVLKGSVLSETVCSSPKFRTTKAILKAREGCVKENVLQENKVFFSASTAANFVRGMSSNGLICWKDKNGKSLRVILNEENADDKT